MVAEGVKDWFKKQSTKIIGDISKHNDNISTYEIGDLYYEGNKAVGIVVDTKDGSKHAMVMSLTSFDENGNHKTTESRLKWKSALNGAKRYGNGWHLPSKKELKAMYKSFDKIQSVLKNTKGALALSDDDGYWSSTEYGSNIAYTLYTDDGDVGDDYGGVFKSNEFYVRAFL